MADKPLVIGAIASPEEVQRETHVCWTRDQAAWCKRYTMLTTEWVPDAMIHRARSRMLTYWWENCDAEVFFWIDSDILWEPGSVESIIDNCLETKSIVAGVVPKRVFSAGIAHRLKPGHPELITGTDALVEAEYMGAAFMAIHRDVLDKIAPTLPLVTGGTYQYWPFCRPMLIDSVQFPGLVEDLSEDWALCRRFNDLDGHCWVDAKPICRHKGTHIFTCNDAVHGRLSESAPLDYVICSTGHSGTGYVAKLLTSAGVPCGHESVFKGEVHTEPTLRADSSFFAVAHLQHPFAYDAKKVHLVRDPLKVIRSWFYAGTYEHNDTWCRQFVDWPLERTIESLAWRWVRWNEFIEREAPDAILVRAEQREGILGKLGITAPATWDDPKYNTKSRSKGKPEILLSQLGDAADAVKRMAERYGYTFG